MSTTSEKNPSKPSRISAHHVRGGAITLVFGAITFALMANEGQIVHGPLYGIFTTLLTVFGLLDVLGLFRREENAIPFASTVFARAEGEPEMFSPKWAATLSVLVLVAGGILLGFAKLPWVIAISLLLLAFPAIRRPGLAAFVVAAGILLPALGGYGLWDPWETHYGEVSREILSRDDWISLWWAQEDWFFSKPILIFWSDALALGALGVPFKPDQFPMHAEWAIRLPLFLVSISAVLAVYAMVSRVWTKRAGLLAAVVLATMPHFFLLAHQAITDMYFVGNMTVAMCLVALALATDPARVVTRYQIGKLQFSGQHAIIAAISAVSLPQILYLVSRNVTMVSPFLFAWHTDRFVFGSAGNGSTPGNKALQNVEPVYNAFVQQPAMQGLLWAVGLAAIVYLLSRERRVQSLLMYGFYFFCALAFMGKGIPGFALPGLVMLLHLMVQNRWKILLDGRLHVAVGILIIVVVGFPWFIAMYARHGNEFTDRLLIHDHLNRLAAAEGVHGDRGSVQYFVLQLGYAMFPWVALVPAAVTAWVRFGVAVKPAETAQPADSKEESANAVAATSADDAQERTRTEILALVGVWFAASFVLFSAMVTKFHHYIFPVVPAAAILVGLLVDRMMGQLPDGSLRTKLAAIGAYLAPILLVVGVGGLRGDLRGVMPEGFPKLQYDEWLVSLAMRSDVPRWVPEAMRASWASDVRTSTAIAAFALIAGLALAAFCAWQLRPRGTSTFAERALTGAAALGAPIVVAFVGRDMSWNTPSNPPGSERLIHLFVYNYERQWPEHIDYRPVLTGFAIAGGLVCATLLANKLRPFATRALLGVAVTFAVWALDVYIVDLSPHWGQRELFERYYQERRSPDEPIVAWQMNWKGENYYTGNRVGAFVDLDNRKLNEWIATQRGKRVFFVLEHSRLSSLRSVLGSRESGARAIDPERGAAPGSREITEITTDRLNNKFILISVQL